jgi:1-acyl-sn-glycerol-3-phosphate acyltransferase
MSGAWARLYPIPPIRRARRLEGLHCSRQAMTTLDPARVRTGAVATPASRVAGQPAPVRWLVRGLLAAYFRRIERFHPGRVPAAGPVLIVANHPGSITDAFLIGVTIPRPVAFVATVNLFRSRPVAWLLSRCGVIPINRKQDDPTKMASVAQTFEHCFAVLEAGGAVGLFPEGVSYDDARLKAVKTGAARLAVGLEAKHGGRLGLQLVPVGLTYSAKERFRSRVLINVGEPFAAAGFLDGYDADPRACVRALSQDIERRIRALIVDTPTLEHDRILAAVRRLYLERLRSANLIVTGPMPTEAETLVLMRAVAGALRHFEQHEPDRLAAFVADLDRYERWVTRFGLTDATVGAFGSGSRWPSRAAATAMLTVAAPVALAGWLHHLPPSALVGWAIEHFTPVANRKSQIPFTVMLAGLIALIVCYPVYIAVVYVWLGFWPAVVYAMALPLSGLVAHRYLRALRQFGGRLRTAGILMQHPFTRRTLVALRARLVASIESFRADYARALVPEIDDVLPR